MLNTGKFAGKTVVISGASRGIGLAIGKKLAKDGANIAILAKSKDPHPKLPGTIYTAAEEIEKAGGKALPCVVDVRDESQVQKAIEDTVHKFGGIDVCVNNASAISMTGTLNTAMKKYDLMNQINARGTFLLSQKCIPYLKQAKNPHILNLSPPLLMEPHWFSNHVAYTMAKYGMSMCVLGMAEEFKGQIAVNALWPKTAIWTSAMAMLSGNQEDSAGSRKVDIVADSAYAMLSKNAREYTGNFALDEDVLKAEGVTDFEQYACKPGAKLTVDFFVPGAVLDDFLGGAERKKSRESLKSGAFEEAVAKLKKAAPTLTKITSSFVFKLSDPKAGTRHFYFANGQLSDQPIGERMPDVFFEMDSDTFVDMVDGSLTPTAAFMGQKLKLTGDLAEALKLERALLSINKQKK